MTSKHYLFIGIVGAIAACIADLLLLYVPYGGYEAWDYAFFKDISPTRLYLGHYIGLFFIPLQLLGFVAVRQALISAPTARINLITALTVYTTILGVAYHASLGQLAIFGHFATQNNVAADIAALHRQTLIAFFEPLGKVLFVLFALLSLIMGHTIWVYQTKYPKRAAWFVPFTIYLLIIAIYCFNKPIGSAFMVAGFNLSILTWFLRLQVMNWQQVAGSTQ